jgi:glucose/arabinose dehydrogenase
MKFYKYLVISLILGSASSCDEIFDFFEEDDLKQHNFVKLNLVADGFDSPVLAVESPDGTKRLFVVDAAGQIFIVKNGEKLSQPFLDIQDKLAMRTGPFDERGLLGLAFHPNFHSNGRFFVYYSGPLRSEAPDTWDHTNYVAEYWAGPASDDADEGSERIILAMDHPQPNHNAGMVAFGSDGYLYISVGDGGGAHDSDIGHVEDWYEENAGGNGQDITQNLMGSILRIDINHGDPYGIPWDNPFVDKDGLDEIFAFGLRNPFRFCFDPYNRIILADAGQELFEEIDLVEKGGNYGWNVKEGRHCFDAENPTSPPSSCPSEDPDGNQLMDPVIEFKNSRSFSDGLGQTGVGGFVYQGHRAFLLKGKYIFGVWAKNFQDMDGAIFAADRSGNDWKYEKLSIRNKEDGELKEFVLGFGQDVAGEVYVLTNEGETSSGKLYRIEM